MYRSTQNLTHTIIFHYYHSDNNDCGVWVAKWMMECMHEDDYVITVITYLCFSNKKVISMLQTFNLQWLTCVLIFHVNNSTRMELAISLVLKDYNVKKDYIIATSQQYWDDQKRRN